VSRRSVYWPSKSEREAAWWRDREGAYRARPGIQQEMARVQAEIAERAAQETARSDELERRIAAGVAGAQEALNAELTLQAVGTDPPEPSAKYDPAEWEAYYRKFWRRDLPVRAQYQADRLRIDAEAPPDVGGMTAAYYELYYPAVTPEELTAEWRGITVEELQAEREADFEAGS
jgi:hypothetical protein